ncbi:uncharacterized transmembrane protein DDB_G0289901-like isoform X2 [Anopheles coustani]|uniref:uncharacterized transmembrane protein DDB_G0289901-like isoform X2 n=1 Tax=Anopheles coustani TaxID=139045 RepID=UPI002659D11C|nr:uncharacterized transmembrane protein DDB_G0289901-like isoform X2 [Anopheles coustani]
MRSSCNMQRRGTASGAILSQQHHPLPRDPPSTVTTAAVVLSQSKDNATGRHGHLRKSSADSSSGGIGGVGGTGKRSHGSVASSNNNHSSINSQAHHRDTDLDDASNGGMGGSRAAGSGGGKDKDEDDIYEFKSTPKDSSSSSSDEKESSAGGATKKGDKASEEKHSSGGGHHDGVTHLGQKTHDDRTVASKEHDEKRGLHAHLGDGQSKASALGHADGKAMGSTTNAAGSDRLSIVSSSGSGVPKRPYSEMADCGDESGLLQNEEETRRKKRKDVDPLGGIKEASVGSLSGTSGGGKSGVGGRGATPRQEKGSRGGTLSSKGLGLSAKNALDRKSPCASPKLQPGSSVAAAVGERNAAGSGATGAVAGQQGAGGNVSTGVGGSASSSSSGKGFSGTSSSNDSDGESGGLGGTGADDGLSGGKGNDSGFGGGSVGGPKVPPLKIVIPQQNAGGDAETGGITRTGKNASTRNHAALPYVVASSNSNDSTADKESTSSRSASPADSKSSDEKNPSQAAKDERTQQRVLRSSHRGGNSNSSLKDGSVDRSNNSSPQMQQQSCLSPSPHSNSGCETGGSGAGAATSQGAAGNRSNSPNTGASGAAAAGETENSGGVNPKSPSGASTAAGSASVEGSGPAGGNTEGGRSTGSGSNGNASGQSGSGSGTAAGASGNSSASSTSSSSSSTSDSSVHPRKRKIKNNKEQASSGGTNASGANATASGAGGGGSTSSGTAATASTSSGGGAGTSGEDKKEGSREETPDVHPHDQPITNCYQMYLNIRKQIERRQRGLFPVQPKPPQGFKDYLMNRCTYALAGKMPAEPLIQVPVSLPPTLRELFHGQEKERHKLKMQHIVEKEKLVLAVEQEILRVHGRAARALANQSVPFSVCTILKDEEVYNIITPEQEEKDRNARSRYNGRLFLSWLQDVDDKWEKIKEAMLLRHHNEAESLHAVQRMDWEFNMKEHALCEFKAKPIIDDTYVPMVNVNDDFDLLPA